MPPLSAPSPPSARGSRWPRGLAALLVVGVVALGGGWLVAPLLADALAPPVPRAVAARPATMTPRLATPAVAAPNATPPAEVARRFLQRWAAGDHAGMYDLLTPAARQRIERAAFIARYQAIAEEAMLLNPRPELTGAANANAPNQPFTLAIETGRAGAYTERNTLTLALADGHWGIDWQPSMIFADLQAGDRVRLIEETPVRGRILDRAGHILARQTPLAAIGVVPEEMADRAAVVERLAATLALSPDAIHAAIAASPPDWFVPLAGRPWEAPPPDLADLARLPGVEIRVSHRRHYPLGTVAAHVIGHVGEARADELPALRARGVRAGEWVGRAGIELVAERELAGERGGRLVIQASDGATRRVLAERRATPAQDVYLTLDLAMQRQAEAALGDRPGATVGLDPATGAVRVMVSRPAFDPNILVRGTRAEIDALLNDRAGRPLVNRALQEGYPAGSTFKVVTMAAAMESLGLRASTSLACPATFRLPNRPEVWRDWQPNGQGQLTLHRGLVQSCNTIFYQLGAQLDQKDPRLLPAMARRFGLGQAAGLGELAAIEGVVPSPEWRRARGEGWATGDAINLSIGQGDLTVTPLQIARAYAAIANGGTLWVPYLVERRQQADGPVAYRASAAAAGRVELAPATLAALRAALAEVPSRLATAPYTAFAGYEGPPVAGKTGTAETGLGGVTHAWFVAYTAVPEASLALAILVERGGEGALVAAPLARRIIEQGLRPGVAPGRPSAEGHAPPTR